MPYESLGEFLAELQDNGELVRIAAQVDSALELAAITDRVIKSSSDGGPALLFEHVKNTTIPVVTNLLGNRRRLCRCLGVRSLEEVSQNLHQRLQADSSGGWLDSLRLGSSSSGLGKWAPKLVKTAACQQVVRMGRDVNLWDLPVPRSWPDESHPVVTSGQLVLNHPVTGANEYCQVPLVVTGPQELGWYDDTGRQSALLKMSVEANRNLPVSISLGGDPVIGLTTAFAELIDARLFAGALRGSSLEVVRCRTNELEVPAGAEIIIEGYIDAAGAKSTMPLSLARGNGRYMHCELPLIQVTAVTHRANPVFPAIIAAGPPSEESWRGQAGDRMRLPFLQRLLPEVVDIHQPLSSAGRNLLFVSIRKTADHQARRILHALWGMESFGQTKLIVIVDADQDLHREEQVWFTVGTHACPRRDFIFSDGLARDDDYTPLSPSLASRVGIDATRKQPREIDHAWPETLMMSDEMAARVRDRWGEYGLEASMNGNHGH